MLQPQRQLEHDRCPDVGGPFPHVDRLLKTAGEAVSPHRDRLFADVASVGLVISEPETGHFPTSREGFRHQPVADERPVNVGGKVLDLEAGLQPETNLCNKNKLILSH